MRSHRLINKVISIIFSLFIFSGTMSDLIAQESPLRLQPVKLSDFKRADVGEPSIKGSVSAAEGGFRITAGGADVWGVKDEFTFVYLQKKGDFDITARINSLTAPHLYTKAGLMARENLTAGCRHIFFQLFPDNRPRNKNNGGFEFQYRQAAGGEMKAVYPPSASGNPEFPVNFPDTWIRLKRTGNIFTGYCSGDGKAWKEYTSFTLDLPEEILLGPAVTSHNTGEAATAVFNNISEMK